MMNDSLINITLRANSKAIITQDSAIQKNEDQT